MSLTLFLSYLTPINIWTRPSLTNQIGPQFVFFFILFNVLCFSTICRKIVYFGLNGRLRGDIPKSFFSSIIVLLFIVLYEHFNSLLYQQMSCDRMVVHECLYTIHNVQSWWRQYLSLHGDTYSYESIVKLNSSNSVETILESFRRV